MFSKEREGGEEPRKKFGRRSGGEPLRRLTVGSRVGGSCRGKRKEMRRKEGIKEDDVMMMCRGGRKEEAQEERYAGIFALEGGLNSSSTETAR